MRPKKLSVCHPDLPNYGNGMCRRCWKKNWYKSDAAKRMVSEYNKTYNHKAKLNRHKRNLKTFNLTPIQYSELLTVQNNVCAICKKLCSSGRKLAVDHSHLTGKNRGLLCTSCNTKLGWYENHKEVIERYLKREGHCESS